MSEIAIYNITNQKTLTNIAINDKNPICRETAINKINNPNHLRTIISSTKYENVRKIAKTKLNKILRKEGRFQYY